MAGLLIGALYSCSDDNAEPDNGIEYSIVTDIDGNKYKTVVIGEQVWMAENLRVTKYNNGDTIPTGLSNSEWVNTNSGAYTIYPHGNISGLDSDEEVLEAYGALYNWFALEASNLCPIGWHVPSHDDWTQLEQYICNALGNSNCETRFPYHLLLTGPRGTNEGNALKSCRQAGHPDDGDCNTLNHPRWHADNTHYGFDQFGFSALPGGFRVPDGGYDNIGDNGYWWSSSSKSLAALAWYRSMDSSSGFVNRNSGLKRLGFSIRCVRDVGALGR